MYIVPTSTFTSLFVVASSLLVQPIKTQLVDFPGRLTADELVLYQVCASDTDCISANNGVCDCANGGVEVSINKVFERDFKSQFPGTFCTQLAREIPCGMGGGNICQNSQCVFQPCANEEGAKECSLEAWSSNEEMTEKRDEFFGCMKEACAVSHTSNSESNVTETFPNHPTTPVQISQSLLQEGKFTKEELEQFQYCESDEDCVYANNGFCDCANGGEEVAVNWDQVNGFEDIFHSRRKICTRMGREIPCGVGSGITCGENNLCKFHQCENLANAQQCITQDQTDFERIDCMKDACKVEAEPERENENDKGVLGTFIVNIFSRGKNP